MYNIYLNNNMHNLYIYIYKALHEGVNRDNDGRRPFSAIYIILYNACTLILGIYLYKHD